MRNKDEEEVGEEKRRYRRIDIIKKGTWGSMCLPLQPQGPAN